MPRNRDGKIVAANEGEIARLTEVFRNRSISRREFNFALGALGLSAVAAGGLVSTAGQSLAATPKRGGTVRVATHSGGPNETLDPTKFTFYPDYARAFMFYNGLVRLNGNLVPEPELAESFEPNANATEWTFRLRKDVVFHDGTPLTSADVIYTLNRHRDTEVASNVASFVAEVEEIIAEDKHTVRVKMRSPDADFATALGLWQFMIVRDGTTDFSTANGTGPFLLKEFDPGVRSVAERNPNYYKNGLPYVDAIEFFPISDSVARINSLLSGDADMITDVPPLAIGQIEQSPGHEVLSTPSGRFFPFVMMTDRAPTDNNDLRLAVKYLQDREKIVASIFKGAATVANDHSICALDPMYCNELPQRQYDPDKAKFHLRASGFEGPLQLKAANVAFGAEEMALLFQQNAAKIGLKVDVQRVPIDGYWSSTWMKSPFHMGGWNMRPVASVMLTLKHLSSAEWNETRFKNERFDKLLVESRGVTDQVRRKEMFCEMETMIHNEGGTVAPAFVNLVDGISSKVKGNWPMPLENLSGGQFPESVWLDV